MNNSEHDNKPPVVDPPARDLPISATLPNPRNGIHNLRSENIPPVPSQVHSLRLPELDRRGSIDTSVVQSTGFRVLLVEDNEINMKLLVACMRKLKLDHATAINGLEALNKYKEANGCFDVIFMGTCVLQFSDLSQKYRLLMVHVCRYIHAYYGWHRVHATHPTL